MNKDTFYDLLERCLDGTADAAAQTRMVEALQSSDKLREIALRIAALDSVLRTSSYDAREFARAFVGAISRKGETREFAVDVVHKLRKERLRADRRQARRTAPKPRATRIPWYIGAAAAAAILLVFFADVFQRRHPAVPTPPSGKATLAYLREQAERARTVKDLFALNELARALYKEEVEKGAKCSLLKLVHLGITTAVTMNPREDRQVQDLCFVLVRAEEAERTASPASVLPDGLAFVSVAEAAATTLSLEDHHRFISSYHEGRKAAAWRKYDAWEKHFSKAREISVSHEAADLQDALFLEHFYVRYYERSMPHTRNEFEKLAAAWPKESPGREYFDTHILPDMDRHARNQRALAANISDRLTRKGQVGGRWTVKTENGILTISQTNASVGQCSKGLDTPDFRDAILVVAHRLDEQQEYTGPDTLTSFLAYFPGKETRTWGPGLAKTLSEKWKDQWLWTWHRLRYVGDGIWESQSVYWWEGSQPVAPWEITEFPGVETGIVEGSMIDRSRYEMSGRLPAAADGIAFATRKTAATWKSMTLRILEPAAGKKKD
jgi:hypothetical protein